MHGIAIFLQVIHGNSHFVKLQMEIAILLSYAWK